MSNLFKTGFANITNVDNEPFVLEVNHKKIIRPVAPPANNKEDAEAASSSVDENGFSRGLGSLETVEPSANEAILSDAMDKAKLLRDDAVLKASTIIAEANEQAEAIFQQAKEDGFKQGLEEGNMEAMRRADEYLENMQKEQEQTFAKFEQDFANRLEEAKSDLNEIISLLVEKITGILVEDYKPVMLHMINEAMNHADTSRKFVIKVSEQSYAYIYENKQRLSGALNPEISIEIFGDPNFSVRQCTIETDNGIIDLSMDVQIKNLTTALRMLS